MSMLDGLYDEMAAEPEPASAPVVTRDQVDARAVAMAQDAAARVARGEVLSEADRRVLADVWDRAAAATSGREYDSLGDTSGQASGLRDGMTAPWNPNVVVDEVRDANGQVVQRTLRNRNDPNDPANWTPEQRRIAGMDPATAPALAPESLRPNDPVVVERRAASDAVAASRMKPADEVEADRASRFRKAAAIDDMLRRSKEVAGVLEEAKGLLKEARGLADRLRDATMAQSVQDLDDKAQQIEDSIDGIVDGL